jgi:hypothetical protein
LGCRQHSSIDNSKSKPLKEVSYVTTYNRLNMTTMV